MPARTLAPGQRADLWILDLDTGEKTLRWRSHDLLVEAPNWLAGPGAGWLVVNGDGKLWRLSVDGEDDPAPIPTPGLDDLNNDHVLDPDGRHVFVSDSGDRQVHRVALPDDRGTVPEPPLRMTGDDHGLWHFLHGVSPDGRELAWIGLSVEADGTVLTNIWCSAVTAEGVTAAADTSPGLRQVTDDRFPDDGSEYSPDGAWLWFNSERGSTAPGHSQLFRVPVAGGDPEQLTFDERVNWFPHLSPDGTRVVYISFPPGTLGHPADHEVVLRELLLHERDEQGRPTHRDLVWLPGGQGTINVNSWSPDSRRIAYVSYPVEGE